MNTRAMDNAALAEMKNMFHKGNKNAYPRTMARRLRKKGFRVDVVGALGAMLRVERRYLRWVNELFSRLQNPRTFSDNFLALPKRCLP
jgi:hypothetical protein